MMEPETFRLDFSVPEADIDVLGHASNIAVARWIQDVALAHSGAVGFGLEAYQRLGAVFVVVRHEIDYLRPALRGDALQARTWISSVMAAKCVRATEVVRMADGRPIAWGRTTWGYVELGSGRPRRIPEELRTAFARFIHPGVEVGRSPQGPAANAEVGRSPQGPAAHTEVPETVLDGQPAG
jgi:acyl-CoA thioester hydrolase